MIIRVPNPSMVVLMGASGSGKSSFAKEHFKPTQVLSSDFFRGLVADDEANQSANADAFELLHLALKKRLAAGRLTVVDATNVQSDARSALLAVAREFHIPPAAIVLDLPLELCQQQNHGREDRQVASRVVRQQVGRLRDSLPGLEKEGFRTVTVLSSPRQIESVRVVRQRLACNRRRERGPFDIIGDVHGCLDELAQLLSRLGYVEQEENQRTTLTHPDGRRAVFLGDLVDRGPQVPGVLQLVMSMVAAGSALCVAGNHDMKLLRKLNGRNVRIAHGLKESLDQLGAEPQAFVTRTTGFLDRLADHYVLDGGRLVVAHAGLVAAMHGRASRAVRRFALYGQTTGEIDAFGLPVRCDWALDYSGRARVVYGHTPVADPQWVNGTINVDTGCVFGGKLSALRYPELELVQVPAARTWYQPAKPLPKSRPPPS